MVDLFTSTPADLGAITKALRSGWRAASGTPVSVVNSAALTLLDYCIVPKEVLSPSSEIHVRGIFNAVTPSGNCAVNVAMNQAGFTPAGNANGHTLLFNGNATTSNSLLIVNSTIIFRNSLHAQISGMTGSAGGAGAAASNNLALSTYDFENNDVEIYFAALNATAANTHYATLLGWAVEVFNQ